jgi:hypothetical protein
MVEIRKCRDCGREVPERPVIVIIEGDVYRFCDRTCAAGFLGNLVPGGCCAYDAEEVPEKGGQTR